MGSKDIVVCARAPVADDLASLLRANGSRFKLAATPEAFEKAVRRRPALAILDAGGLGADFDLVWKSAQVAAPATKALIVAGSQEQTGALISQDRVSNLIGRNDEIHPRDLKVTVEKLLDGDVFGMARYLEPGAAVTTLKVCGSADKQACLAAAADCGARAGLTFRQIDQVAQVVDEMVTNAVYNAPVDAQGNRLFASWARDRVVELTPAHQSTLRLGTDSKRLAVAVEDPFGSLAPGRVFDYLAKCFRKGHDQIDRKEGGAGLGLYMMFESLSHFVINIAAGKRTEVIGIMDVTPTYRDFARRSKSFNLFMEGNRNG